MSEEFPFVGSVSDTAAEDDSTDTDDLPLLTEYAWDFEQDKFLYDGNGHHIIVTGQEALKVWIYKALKTERYEHEAYSWSYGIELKPFIGKVMSVEERYSELQRVIKECLMVSPYIKSIDKVDFSHDGSLVTCQISLTSVYGQVILDV